VEFEAFDIKEEYMSLFTWSDKYLVGNVEMDNHHKTLFNILNRLYESSLITDSSNSFDTILEELISYSKYHLIAEEQYMIDKGYKDIYRHIIENEEFTDMALDIKRNKDDDDKELCR
jgi:hemerythrin